MALVMDTTGSMGSTYMSQAKTAAERQADRKARELAAGRVQWRRWVHPDDVPALAEYADKLARKRAKAQPGTRAGVIEAALMRAHKIKQPKEKT